MGGKMPPGALAVCTGACRWSTGGMGCTCAACKNERFRHSLCRQTNPVRHIPDRSMRGKRGRGTCRLARASRCSTSGPRTGSRGARSHIALASDRCENRSIAGNRPEKKNRNRPKKHKARGHNAPQGNLFGLAVKADVDTAESMRAIQNLTASGTQVGLDLLLNEPVRIELVKRARHSFFPTMVIRGSYLN